MDETRDPNPWGSPEDDPDADDELTVTSLRGKPAPATPAPTATATATSPRPRWRVWYRLGAAVTLLALLLASLIVVVHPNLADLPWIPKPTPDPLVLHVASATQTCGSDSQAAWSPDGTRIALMKGAFRCGSQDASSAQPTEQLMIYDAHTGRETSHIDLRALVLAQVVPATVRQSPVLLGEVNTAFFLSLWSPDGTTFATMFAANSLAPASDGSQTTTYGQGLLLVTIATGKARVLTYSQSESMFGSLGQQSSGITSIPALRWNLERGTHDIVNLQPALAYRWEKNGTLTATQPLPTTPNAPPPAARSGPNGNPIGGASFTIWQSGQISYNVSGGCPQGGQDPATVVPTYSPDDYYTVQLGTPVWSPDSHYLVMLALSVGRLAQRPTPPAPTPTPLPGSIPDVAYAPGGYSCSDAGAAERLPRLPIRDAGMRAAVSLITLNTQPSVQLTWRPDGQRLAVMPGNRAPGSSALLIYDCATGHVRAHFTPEQITSMSLSSPGDSVAFSQVSWSPDGTRLLLLPTGPTAAPVVLGPKSLGG